VRLTESEQQAIVNTAREVFGNGAGVRLFGSRVDDTRRGGDLDLLVDVPESATDALNLKIRFLVELKQKIGDRKIDVVIRGPDSVHKPIYDVAEREGVMLQ
jgi:predicted nucleotidyltransferase